MFCSVNNQSELYDGKEDEDVWSNTGSESATDENFLEGVTGMVPSLGKDCFIQQNFC